MSLLFLFMSAFAEDQTDLAMVSFHLDMFYQDCARYPTSLEELVRKPADCPNWGPDPYDERTPRDRWGNEFYYRRLARDRFELKSLGADGREGGTGDDMDVEWRPSN